MNIPSTLFVASNIIILMTNSMSEKISLKDHRNSDKTVTITIPFAYTVIFLNVIAYYY